MTLAELVAHAGRDPTPLALLLTLPPAFALLARLGGPDPAGTSPRRHLFAVLVYLACIPGIMATVLTGYMLYLGANLLELNVLVFFAPIVTMAATLMFITRTTPLDRVPGFDRIGGLMLMLAASFILALIIAKTRIWVVFSGGLGALLVLGLVLFVAIRVGAWKLMGGRAESERREAARRGRR